MDAGIEVMHLLCLCHWMNRAGAGIWPPPAYFWHSSLTYTIYYQCENVIWQDMIIEWCPLDCHSDGQSLKALMADILYFLINDQIWPWVMSFRLVLQEYESLSNTSIENDFILKTAFVSQPDSSSVALIWPPVAALTAGRKKNLAPSSSLHGLH